MDFVQKIRIREISIYTKLKIFIKKRPKTIRKQSAMASSHCKL